jgi:hypothetical protein
MFSPEHRTVEPYDEQQRVRILQWLRRFAYLIVLILNCQQIHTRLRVLDQGLEPEVHVQLHVAMEQR